ncbi:MAG: hypothetical protein KF757_04040 [Phycisphaeraceae bacterium]|nr:hypothetical protein [Phycisphaeraceae bacterium]MCW5763172.1 hypothetical protein [Phycisphaeraceae bacterium]
MNGVKPWQLAVIVLGLLGGTGLLVWNAMGKSSKVQTIDEMSFVDVLDGSMYVVNLRGRRGIGVPARNPDTGEYTLMPVFQDGNEWVIPDYYRPALKTIDTQSAEIVNPASGQVRPAAGKPRAYPTPKSK